MTSKEFTGTWRKPSRSGGGGAQCVEARCTSATAREVRDSKAPLAGSLAFGGSAWAAFLTEVRRG
ncbi:hypothetical protein JOF56_000138 [Kibdelosporangium banguiense]|uniref:DUF397 domain-containing protein n=1 Tax=Kibdelosporangium banguiense TaxID=1365924 RepID=A0ABS4T5P4_9PSEU|nr:DUF397 domain-containing protein [Kibdelosporangium banguiense]MBP2319753.1 hypothetical protein [Kibdelosporangium banguiense]